MLETKEKLAYRLEEFARAIGIKPQTYRKWKREGVVILPREIRVGGVVLIEAAEAKAWLQRQRIR